ncbi:MAG: hypothetical protein Fur0022_13320 [Anaerolineales bacterium]
MLEWFPQPTDLTKYLDQFGHPPNNFDPEQPIDNSWHVDQHEIPLGLDRDGLFERAVNLLLRYQFYPPSVLRHTSDFARENRNLRFSDRIVQRIHAIPFLLDVITMNRITATFAEPNRIGFTYTTTEHHLEMGEWTATILRKRDGQVALVMHALSKPGPKMPWWARPFSRAVQIRAHRLGLAHFQHLLHESRFTHQMMREA